MSLATAGRRLARTLAFLPVLVLIAGCDPDPYPASLEYPARADLLVIQANGRDIPQTFGPGQLDTHLNNLREKAEEDPSNFQVIDPAQIDREKRQEIAQELLE